jgi:hypothetical protein
MNRLLAFLTLILILLSGCRKSTNNSLWESSYGSGTAMFLKAAADSGLLSCGELGRKPYIIKLDKNKKKTSDYKYNANGLYSSAWSDGDLTIAAGNTNGRMLITCLNNKDSLLWDTTFISSYHIDYSSVCYLGSGEILVVGSEKPDSILPGPSSLLYVWLNTSGSIIKKQEIKDGAFISANRVITDNSGNIYLALTRQYTGSKSKATVAKYDNQLHQIFETELYNNPIYGATTTGILLDNTGNIYVCGKTELPVSTGTANNSFAASLTSVGTIIWKTYLENSNTGASLIIDKNGQVLMLNHNCFIINILNMVDGSETGKIRTFSVCDSNKTDVFGQYLDFNYDGNIIVAGSNGGGFYLGLKSPVPEQVQ